MQVEDPERLHEQIQFLNEIEKLKVVYRRNKTVAPVRFENSAEHSWHVALMALLLSEHANNDALDLLKVVKMLLIHDLVEIYAGDTWLYDVDAAARQGDKEAAAADKLFALLPADQATEFRSLWDEFEARESAEATYAASIDALQPLLNHLLTSEQPEEPRPTTLDVLQRKRHIAHGSEALWAVAQAVIEQSTAEGLYRAEEDCNQ